MDLLIIIALFVLYLVLTNLYKYLRKSNYSSVKATPKDLDPRTTQFMSSKARQRYLASNDWAIKRATRLGLDNYTCQSCGSTSNLNIHHITYERFGYEDINHDLITLCQSCHQSIHDKLGYDRTTNYPLQESANEKTPTNLTTDSLRNTINRLRNGFQ